MSKRNPMAKLIAQIEDGEICSEKTIYEKYLDHTKKYKDLYGTKTVILMMVGSFYELYGLKTDPSRSIAIWFSTQDLQRYVAWAGLVFVGLMLFLMRFGPSR